MNISYIRKTDFLSLEYITEPKVLLDICDKFQYGVTDSNEFYSLYYVKPAKTFNVQKNKQYGDVFFTDIFTHHKICHMVCVEWPKSITNMVPFKYKHFKTCCNKLAKYIEENKIKNLVAPVFGKEILEGNWTEILGIIKNTFPNADLTVIRQ